MNKPPELGLGESREPLPCHLCGTMLDPNWLNCPKCEGPSHTSKMDEASEFSQSLAEMSLAPEGFPEQRTGSPYSFPRNWPVQSVPTSVVIQNESSPGAIRPEPLIYDGREIQTVDGEPRMRNKLPSVPAEIEPK